MILFTTASLTEKVVSCVIFCFRCTRVPTKVVTTGHDQPVLVEPERAIPASHSHL